MDRAEIITEIYKPLMEKITSVEKKLDDYLAIINTQRASDIDFIAMETGVELEQEDEA